MTVYGCSGCGRMLTLMSWKAEDELSDLRTHGFAGCPVCGHLLCSQCAVEQKLACPRCEEGEMVLNERFKPTGDWRLPERFRKLATRAERLAEFEVMKAEWQAEFDNGRMSRAQLWSLDYYEQVINDDPRADNWYHM